VPHLTAKCATPGCTNTSYRLHCPTCLALEAGRRSLQADQGACIHVHSITGNFDMVRRLLPEYAGGKPQDGYLLDVCKSCLKELEERPENPSRPAIRH
jgi:hypothetical protein